MNSDDNFIKYEMILAKIQWIIDDDLINEKLYACVGDSCDQLAMSKAHKPGYVYVGFVESYHPLVFSPGYTIPIRHWGGNYGIVAYISIVGLQERLGHLYKPSLLGPTGPTGGGHEGKCLDLKLVDDFLNEKKAKIK